MYSLQQWAKNMLKMFVIQHISIWPNFILIVYIYLGFKRSEHKFNFYHVAMPLMMSQILKFIDFTKTEKSSYLKNKTSFLQIKKFTDYTSMVTLSQKNSFAAEVTFSHAIKFYKVHHFADDTNLLCLSNSITKTVNKLVNADLKYLFLFYQDSLHPRLNSHYEAQSYWKKRHKKKINAHRKSA